MNMAAVATPDALVVAVFTPPANVPLAPLPGAVNVTVTPLTRLPPASLTVAWNCVVKAAPTVALCGVPAVAAMLAAAPVKFVMEKFAGEATPETLAVTVYEPAVLFAVKTAEIATPEAFVTAVFTPPANVPLAPLPGAANVTVTPFTGLFPESVTVTWSCAAKAVLMVALCGVPAVAVIFAGGLPKFVREKLAAPLTPEAEAVTV